MKESQSKNKGELSIEEFFALPKIKRYIEIAHIVSENEPNHIDLVYHFSMGLYLNHCDKEYFKNDIVECLKPVVNLLIEWAKSEKFRKTLLEKIIPGDETVTGTQVPVSVNGLLKFIDNYKAYTGKEIEPPLIPKDIIPIVTEFYQYKKSQFADDKPSGKIKKAKDKSDQNDNKYTLRQVAIAYSFLGGDYLITSHNYLEIVEKYTTSKSNKILQKRINNPSDLTKLSGNKSTDTRTKNDLMGAKRLLSGIDDSKAIKGIDDVINTFLNNYNLKY
jgi:hypothetical protein